ncbi:hypothetical protein CK223_32240 [Mesorhizobium loti]|nr:hypothetical protein CK223_32240 [Mesorhizobium loti]
MTEHVRGLLRYLSHPFERANEDLAVAYFRSIFGEAFQRQADAKRADGYVAGAFVLELKGRSNDWLSGLLQGLAYQNEELDFAQVVVAAKSFLAIWQANEIPVEIRSAVAAATGAPNKIGRELAKRYAARRSELLHLAAWNGSDLFTPLFESQQQLVAERIQAFEDVLRSGKRVRQKITVRNFTNVLREMVPYFEAEAPVKAVRAFFSMIYAWNETSIVQISNRVPDQAALGGETIASLVPAMRQRFKAFVEARFVSLDANADYDDFFARYDEALDAVDPEFRRRHGIFFTDLSLSKFAMWIAKQHIPGLGEDYLVIDPACGSGNLVTNWRSPLELRHKVVSEIEPELLFAVEQRMKGDLWHNGRFTIVPRVSENRGLNFLDRSAEAYLDELRAALADKGHAPDKPLAILCNPPYRSDDDQAAGAIPYAIHPTILKLTGSDASSERYCCFLAQMKLVCEAARSSGLPGNSLLLLFTKSAWLTDRAIFRKIRSEMAGSFEDVSAVLVNGSEFFDVRGSWPVAFTIWRYKGATQVLDDRRPIPIKDLTWLKHRDLSEIPWADPAAAEKACRKVMNDERSKVVELGRARPSIRSWSGISMTDFKRDRRRSEAGQEIVGGLPLNDARRANKKTYGEASGQYAGFMDDLTPCRVKRSAPSKPWFRLNSQFMDVKRNRCFSGPPTHWGYCAQDLEAAQKLFFWYSLARTFVQIPYPMWTDADDLWAPAIPIQLEPRVLACSSAIVFAENECVETYFPANNPVSGTQEILVRNPLSPLDPDSFWSQTIRPRINAAASPAGLALIQSVDEVFARWSQFLGRRRELPIQYAPPYFVDERSLSLTAGLVQIRDYARHQQVESLLAALAVVQTRLKAAKAEFYDVVTAESGLNYFGRVPQRGRLELPTATSFQKVLARRLAVAGLLVKELHDDPNFGRTKLAKLFYLADKSASLQLQTDYARDAAGPLDQRALYNQRVGVEALAVQHQVFKSKQSGRMVRYEGLAKLGAIGVFAREHLGDKADQVMKVIDTCRGLTTDQSEIIATLHACWNDLIIRKEPVTYASIIDEFLGRWHPKKARFSQGRLRKAIQWMHGHDLVPTGTGSLTSAKR